MYGNREFVKDKIPSDVLLNCLHQQFTVCYISLRPVSVRHTHHYCDTNVFATCVLPPPITLLPLCDASKPSGCFTVIQ